MTPKPKDGFETSVHNCARCGKDHMHIWFEVFTIAPEEFTHWGMCPKTDEPILMIIKEVPEALEAH